MSAAAGLGPADRGLRLQAACTSVVVLGSAYASYRHGRDFALRFGADATTAAIWPIIVDGLLAIATVELWKPEPNVRRASGLSGGGPGGSAGRWSAWLSLVFGIGLSLCANVASAPELSPFAIAVAGSPPIALLFSIEMLNRALKRQRTKLESCSSDSEAVILPGDGVVTASTDEECRAAPEHSPASAAGRMWAYYCRQKEIGHQPTGAELDRIAGTNNYGRRVLARWRESGLLSAS